MGCCAISIVRQRARLDGFATPQIGFNYLGRFGGAAPASAADWGGAPEAVTLGSGGDPAMPLAHALEVNALTLDGPAGAELSATWSWAPALLSDQEVRDLAQRWFQALEALVRHVAQPEAGGRTPSDLPLLALSQAEIERLEQRYPRIEDILPLSPLQEGLLFHALYDAQAPDVYTVQLVLSLQGPLDGAALQAAVQALIDRHASLRAGFQHENLSRPVQIIVPHLAAPCHRIDLSLLESAEREQRLAGILREDRAERFDLASPPLIRFTLIRLAADEHRLVLTNHHILMDGWSTPVLVQELLTLYAHRGDAGALPRVTPYRDYLAWIAGQDRAAATAAWQEALAGLEEGTHVAPPDRKRVPVAPEQITLSLSESLTTALTRQARAQGLTLNTLMQAAWAILLGRLTGRDDVVFGITVAGRPPEIAGIESMVGLFINTLPLRVRLPASKPLLAVMKELQDGQSRLMAHQHLGLAEIQSLAGLGELFDTLAVFENYPVDRGSSGGRGRRPAARPTSAGTSAPHYPLSLDGGCRASGCSCGSTIGPTCSSAPSVEAMVGRLIRLLEAMVAEPERAIGSLDLLTPEERRTILQTWNDTARAVPVRHLCRRCSPPRSRAPPTRWRWCSRSRASATRELDARANQLAHHLRALGVGPETVVGLCVERSPAMLIGLLGILKAGGAYLPLDPELSARAPGVHARRCRRAGAGHALGTARSVARRMAARIVRLDADAPAIARQPTSAPASGPRAATPRLRHLHVGLHRNAQGRRQSLMTAWSTIRVGRSLNYRLTALDRACRSIRRWRSTRSIPRSAARRFSSGEVVGVLPEDATARDLGHVLRSRSSACVELSAYCTSRF